MISCGRQYEPKVLAEAVAMLRRLADNIESGYNNGNGNWTVMNCYRHLRAAANGVLRDIPPVPKNASLLKRGE